MSTFEYRLADLLMALEIEMRRIDLWESAAPSAQALQSPEPFCIDTLTLPQWLQWIFLPRIKSMLERGEALPAVSDIYPLAEEVLADLDADTSALLRLIRQFDELICGRR